MKEDLLIADIVKWFQTAKPEPTTEDACVQIGCHYEELKEMAQAMGHITPSEWLERYAELHKNKEIGISRYVLNYTEVNRSNWSKFTDGRPTFDDNGKIAKGADYFKPDLEKFIGGAGR